MIVKQKGLYRIVTLEVYNGCLPITVYMVQRLEKRTLLSDKWINVKGYDDYDKAESLLKFLTE